MEYQIHKDVTNQVQDIYIYQDNDKRIPLNSLYSPEKEAARYLDKLVELKQKLIVFIGFGNGTLLESLISHDLFKKNVHFLFIEPFSEIPVNEKHRLLLLKTEKITYINLKDFNSLVFAKVISKFTSIPVEIKIHPNYTKIPQTKIKECLKIINEGIETKQILNNTELKFAIDWIVEPLLNIQSVANSINIKDLKGKFEGERAILIASGPSLKSHIKFLQESKESFHLFAVGSALRALMENDIKADYVLSVDASDRNYETHFEGLSFDGTLIFETMSNSNIQKNHQGQLIVSRSFSDHVTESFVNDLYSFPQASPSVAIYTLQVIEYLGFSEVYLVGQDLALVNGDYYAEGIKHHEGMMGITGELFIENNKGDQVETTRSLKIFLDAFESLIKKLPSELKIFNLSEIGAKIEGVPFIPYTQVKSIPKRLVEINTNSINPSANSLLFIEDFISRLELLKKDVSDAIRNLDRIINHGVVSSNDMVKVVKGFRGVTKHKILEEVILSQLTFMFDAIINKFAYLEEKQKYTSDDLLLLVRDLEAFYNLVSTFVEDLLTDHRLAAYKQ